MAGKNRQGRPERRQTGTNAAKAGGQNGNRMQGKTNSGSKLNAQRKANVQDKDDRQNKDSRQNKMRTTVNAKPKKKHTIGVLSVSGAVAVLCSVLLISSYGLQNKINEYDAVAKNLQEQINEQLIESQELDRESEYIKTKEYMEQIARDKLGLVKKNEIIFKKEGN